MSASSIKAAVKANLDALAPDVLAGATMSDLRKDPLDADIPAFPWAFLMPPAMESAASDNRTNTRTHVYDILVLWKAENIEDDTTLETNIEAILNKFDNDPTLKGTALGGVLPVSSAPVPFQHAGRDLIGATIQIQAKEFVSLTF